MTGWYHHLNLCYILHKLFDYFLFGVGMGIGVRLVSFILEKP